MRIVVSGRIQTGSYTNRDGNKVYTTDVAVEEQEFAQSKAKDQQITCCNTGSAASDNNIFTSSSSATTAAWLMDL